MDINDSAAPPEISDKFIKEQSSIGQDLYDKQRNGPPREFPVASVAGSPSLRDALITGLLGLHAGTQAGVETAKLGSPGVGLLAGLGAGAVVPSQLEQMKLQHMQSLPVEQVSPGLVEAHPELQGVPLGIVHQLQPFILSKDRLDNAKQMFINNASLRMEMAKASPAMQAFFESQMGMQPGTLASLKAAEEGGLKAGVAGGKMSPETLKLLENSKDGMDSISKAKDIISRTTDATLKKAALGGKLGDIARLGDEDAQALHTYLKNAADVITRLRTGAALNKNEEEYYGKIVNDFFKTGKVNREQIDRLDQFFQTVKADIEAGKRGAGVLPDSKSSASSRTPKAASKDPAGIHSKPGDPLGIL